MKLKSTNAKVVCGEIPVGARFLYLVYRFVKSRGREILNFSEFLAFEATDHRDRRCLAPGDSILARLGTLAGIGLACSLGRVVEQTRDRERATHFPFRVGRQRGREGDTMAMWYCTTSPSPAPLRPFLTRKNAPSSFRLVLGRAV